MTHGPKLYRQCIWTNSPSVLTLSFPYLQSCWVGAGDWVIASVRIGGLGLDKIRVDGDELAGTRIVVAVDAVDPALATSPSAVTSTTGSIGTLLVNPATGLCLNAPATATTPLTLAYCATGYPRQTWRTS